MNRDEIRALLMEIFREFSEDLRDRAVNERGSAADALHNVSSAADGLCIEYHISQIDELVQRQEEAEGEGT